MRKIFVILTILILSLVVFTSCKEAPNTAIKDGIVVADSNSNLDEITDEDHLKDIAEFNSKIIEETNGSQISFEVSNDDDKKLIVNATVELDGIEKVGSYNYIPKPISDEIRESLFNAYFGDKVSELEYAGKNNIWKLHSDGKRTTDFGYETSFNYAGGANKEERMILACELVRLCPFEENKFNSLSYLEDEIPLDDAILQSEEMMNSVIDVNDFCIDYIHPYGASEGDSYYKIMYRYKLGNTVLTGYNDIFTYVDKHGVERIEGTVFDIDEKIMENKIITIEEADERLKNNLEFISFEDKDEIHIGKIKFEYITCATINKEIEIMPIWRFEIGKTEDEMNFNRNKILAVNAISGDIIFEKRGW